MEDPRTRLVKLSSTDLTVADPAEDIRGRTVKDRDGDDIGKVDDLMIDQDERKVRYLQVGSGGFLGLGEKHFLIPVDAITRVDQDNVYINQTRSHVAGAPEYDPNIVSEPSYWDELSGYYGYGPYWAAGYVYPPYPFYE